MSVPPSNRDPKGTTVEVWVFVDEQGKVVADSTRLNPPTKDRSFNQRLVREAAEWVFRPALQAGKPVASWIPYRSACRDRRPPGRTRFPRCRMTERSG